MVRNRIKELREEKKMSRQELAKIAGISVSHLTHVENHTKPLTTTLAVRMAGIFGVKFKDIFL